MEYDIFKFDWFAFIITVVIFLMAVIPPYKNIESLEMEKIWHFWGIERMAIIIHSLLSSTVLYFFLVLIINFI